MLTKDNKFPNHTLEKSSITHGTSYHTEDLDFCEVQISTS